MDIKLNYLVKRATFEGWRIPSRYIQDYELVYIRSGYGEIRIDDREIFVEAGDLICFRPGIKNSLWSKHEPYMEFYALHFWTQSAELIEQIPEYMHLESRQWLEALFKNLLEEWPQKGELGEWKKEIIVQQILCELLTRIQVEQNPISNRRVREVLSYIHENPFREFKLEDLLEKAGIKKTLFLQNFRSVTGTTPLQYILNLRLESARDLLLETELQVSTIGKRCGFTDPFYFSKCFKKKYSQSPREYRENQKYNV